MARRPPLSATPDIVRPLPMPARSSRAAWHAWLALHAVALPAAALVLAWQADGLAPAVLALWLGTLLASTAAFVAALTARMRPGVALVIEAGALATATAALGWTHWHWLFKPAAMVLALATIAAAWRGGGAPGALPATSRPALRWLAGAVAASLAGDVFLMLPADTFLPGLASFLLAHLCYLVLFHHGVPWFGARAPLVAVLAVAAGMYAFLLQGGLPPALRLPVAVYVLVIALMAAQALGRHRALRARVRGTGAVALGALLFMASDALLATDRFVHPLPWAPVWVLASYFAAQALIVGGMLQGLAAPGRRTTG